MTKAETYSQRRARLEAALINGSISLDEFAQRVEVTYDDRWKWFSWRVRGIDQLDCFIHDVRQKRTEERLTDAQVILEAYDRLCAIQERKGQVNIHSIYVEGEEEIFVVERRNLEHATVNIVQDRVDKRWRWATSYWIHNGGGSYAPGLTRNIVHTREDAIINGASSLLASIVGSYEYREGNPKVKTFANKIENFIGDFRADIIQPSLFG